MFLVGSPLWSGLKYLDSYDMDYLFFSFMFPSSGFKMFSIALKANNLKN